MNRKVLYLPLVIFLVLVAALMWQLQGGVPLSTSAFTREIVNRIEASANNSPINQKK